MFFLSLPANPSVRLPLGFIFCLKLFFPFLGKTFIFLIRPNYALFKSPKRDISAEEFGLKKAAAAEFSFGKKNTETQINLEKTIENPKKHPLPPKKNNFGSKNSTGGQEFARLTKFLVLFDRPTPEQREALQSRGGGGGVFFLGVSRDF